MANLERIAVIGDVHGHLQLALCMAARWQRELARPFDAVFLCGDVGTFTESSQLDSATRSHARNNPCEFEFLDQWATPEPAPWLAHIFQPPPDGLDLLCPVAMVHGNHEGFAHLETLAPRRPPAEPVSYEDLPAVDTSGFIRFLPTGWRIRTPAGHLVAGIGGIEAGQRKAKYHEMAFIDDSAVERLIDAGPVDVLITHQGPAVVQGDGCGSPTFDMLLEARAASVWFHGHATPVMDLVEHSRCTVVPLGDVAFGNRGNRAEDPGLDGFAYVELGEGLPRVVREQLSFWRDYRRSKWTRLDDGRLVCPDLAPFLWHRGSS